MKAKNVRNSHRLGYLIEEAMEAMPDASSVQIATQLIAKHGAVVNAWAFERLVALCQSKRQRKNPMLNKRPRLGHPKQERLPGFEDIPEWIYIPRVGHKYGVRKRLLNATLQDQVESLQLALNESAAQLSQRRRLIALTRRYDRGKPGITVAEVFSLQAIRNKEAARKREARIRAKSRTKNH